MAGRIAEHVKAERDFAVKKFYENGMFAVDPGASEQKLWRRNKKAKIALKFPEKIMQAFVAQDKWLIRRCDALLVMTGDTPSDGTWREMCYAEQIGIPVIAIAPRRKRKELMGWTNIEVPYIVDNLEGAIRLIKRRWVKEYEAHKKYFDAAIRNAEAAVNSGGRRKRKRIRKSTKLDGRSIKRVKRRRKVKK